MTTTAADREEKVGKRSVDGWAICSRDGGPWGEWYPLLWTISRKRVEAIAQFDYTGEHDSTYAEERKAGRMRAMRVRVNVEGR